MADLNARIRQLEVKQFNEAEELKTSFRELAQSINPANLIRSAVQTVVSTPGLKATAIDTAISSIAGSLGKKLVVQNSGNIIRKAVGSAVQFMLMNVVRNKMPAAKEKLAELSHQDREN